MPEVIVDRPELVVDAVARVRIDHRQESVRFTALEEIQVPVVADLTERLKQIEEELVIKRAEIKPEVTREWQGLTKQKFRANIDTMKGEQAIEKTKAKNAVATPAAPAADATKIVAGFYAPWQHTGLNSLRSNADKLTVRAPLSGMAALLNVWRNGSMGPFQDGDQAWPGQGMIKLFDPTDMVVITLINEPDGAVLARGGAHAKIRLDAYPGVVFDAHFESASPVASAGLDSPIKYFSARFRIDQRDPRLLPDLSAAVEIEAGK